MFGKITTDPEGTKNRKAPEHAHSGLSLPQSQEKQAAGVDEGGRSKKTNEEDMVTAKDQEQYRQTFHKSRGRDETQTKGGKNKVQRGKSRKEGEILNRMKTGNKAAQAAKNTEFKVQQRNILILLRS